MNQIEGIYHAVLNVEPARRESFLSEQCGADEDLRREVVSLLSFESAEEIFFDQSPASLAAEMFAGKNWETDLTDRKSGHYRIVKLLGKGEMGEVYLAEDTKLDRLVALKILAQEFSANAARMRRRFVQEAKAASALNHPHIAHIYEIGEVGGVNFIAMEFVEGVSLREKIYVERVSLRTLLKYLAQVADGLGKAHHAGIVHRDLKPDNLMISGDGFAKILDFGLAKVFERRNRESETLIQSSENNPRLTEPGMIMGTVGYMSPEQARGQTAIDARSDIFLFGCILYEAVTRRQLFAGETMVDRLHSIIHAQPSPIRDFNPDAPNGLQRIVRRCLQKDPEDRYQTIKDVATELKELRREIENAAGNEFSASLESTAGLSVSNSTEKTSAPTDESVIRTTSSAEYLVGEAKKHKTGAVLVAAVLMLIVTSIGYGVYLLAAKPDNSAVSFQPANFTRLTTTGKASGVAISPDGKLLAYFYREDHGPWRIAVAAFESGELIKTFDIPALPNPSLRWTPDGQSVAYVVTENGVSNIVAQLLNGGKPKPLSDFKQERIFSFDYSHDGKQIALSRGTIDNDVVLINNFK